MEFLSRPLSYLPLLLQGMKYTIGITVLTFVVATLVGLLFGAASFQLGNPRGSSRILPLWKMLASFFITLYVRVFKGIPALTLLFLIYFALPQYNITINSLWTSVIGLGLIGSAMLTEVFRSGFSSLPVGQREAALAAGLTPQQTLWIVLLPQIWRIALPSLANYAIGLLKDTAIIAAVAAPEIMFYARNLVTTTFDTATVYLLVAVIYFTLSFPLARIADLLERRARRGRR